MAVIRYFVKLAFNPPNRKGAGSAKFIHHKNLIT